MKNRIKKITSAILACLVIFSTLQGAFAATGYNKNNISSYVGQKIIDLNYYHSSKGYYPYKKRLDSKGDMQCVGYAYARLEEKLGLSPDFSSGAGAKDIPANAPNGATRTSSSGQNYKIEVYKNDRGSHLTANSWACFGAGNSVYGHVIYVEEVIGNTVYYTESGTSMWKNGTTGKLKSKSKSSFINNCSSGGKYVGTVVFRPTGKTTGTTSGTSSSSVLSITKPTVTVTSYPTSIKPGRSFGLRGSIKANGAKTTVKTSVINSKGKTVLSATDTIGANSTGDIKNMNANSKLSFGKLGAGTYTLKFSATNSKGTTNWEKKFTVQATPSSLKVNLTSYPTSLAKGKSYGLRGSVTSNYNITSVKGYIINSKGTTVQSSSDTPNAKSMDIRYSNVNNRLIFNKLAKGTYTLKVVAKDSSGKSHTWSKKFTVK